MSAELDPTAPDGTSTLRAVRSLWRGAYARLIGAQVLGQAGDGLAQIAFAQLVLFEPERGATPWELTKLLAVTLLPFSMVGPLAGVMNDRLDRRRVLVGVSVLRSIIVALAAVAALGSSTWWAYVVIVALLSCSRFVGAAKGAALPHTVADPDQLVTANALSSFCGVIAAFGGAASGALIVQSSPAAGLVLASGAYLIASIRFRRLPPVGGGHPTETLTSSLARLRDDLAVEVRTVVATTELRRPLLAVGAHRLLLGAGSVVLVLVADTRYDLEATGYAVALVVTGAGAFIGTWAAPELARRFDDHGLQAAAFVAAGAATVVAASRPELGVLVLAVGVVAMAFQILKVVADALVQRAAPDHVRGRAFAVYDLLYNAAFVAAALALVPLWEEGDEHRLLWGIAGGFVATGGLFARTRPLWPWSEGRTTPRGVPDLRLRFAALCCGALMVLAFPEPGWSWLAPVGLVPLALVVRRAVSPRESVVLSWLGGVGFFCGTYWWLVPSSGPAPVLLAMLLGLSWVPWGRLWWSLARPGSAGEVVAAIVLPAAAWVVGEFVRSWEALGGPWNVLGASQWERPRVLALAAFGGVWLVSAVLVVVNGAVALLAVSTPSRSTRPTAVALVGLALVLVLAAAPRAPVADERLLVAGVQPGVIDDGLERFAAAEAATRTLAEVEPDLVVWGESSVGFDLDQRPDLLRRLQALAGLVEADLLVNVDARGADDRIAKASVLVSTEGVVARYDKMRLVPFGEYIPFRTVLGWLGDLTEAAGEDRRRGDRLVLMESAGVTFGPLVCFESAFSDLTRELVDAGADLVIVQSANTTFQDTWAPEQHASLAAV